MSGPAQGELKRLAAEAVAALRERGFTVALAESTTGGLIGHLLTEVPGSSAVFLGGVVAYQNSLKQKLGVPPHVLEDHGAVSAETSRAMARAARVWASADVGLAETGIAGPTGGSAQRPVGLFYIAIALADLDGPIHDLRTGCDDRSTNKSEAARAALTLLITCLKEFSW